MTTFASFAEYQREVEFVWSCTCGNPPEDCGCELVAAEEYRDRYYSSKYKLDGGE